MNAIVSDASRRKFLQGATALVVGCYLAPLGRASSAMAAPNVVPFAPNAFIRIGTNDIVTVLIKHIEMGQGPWTGLSTLVAEELDADWSQMRAEHSPADVKLYNNLAFGPLQATGGSSAIANSFEQMRKAGATARALLVQAAAAKWNVPTSEITVENGVIRHAKSKHEGRFGEFTQAAAKLKAPADVPLKDPANFRYIGKENVVKKLDVPSKVNGTAKFTMDIQEPGMLTVVVARPPRFGAKVKSVDAAAALAVKGVKAVKTLSTGVAVYADGTWPAIKARKLLKIEWDDAGAESRGTAQLFEEFRATIAKPGVTAEKRGDPDKVLGEGKVLEVDYAFPYLAHAPMEPLDAVLSWDDSGVRARFGSQIPTLDQGQIGKFFGVAPEKVQIETLLAGGSFGRRIDLGNDYIQDLCEAAKAIGPKQAIKLVRTREDDIRGGFYRPVMLHRLRGRMHEGKIAAWTNTMVGQSFVVGTAFEPMMLKDGVDGTMVEGAKNLPYAVDHFRCDAHIAKVGVPVTSWRSVGSTHTTYATECFVDQLLIGDGQDPIKGRIALLEKSPRHVAALEAVAKLAEWSGPGPVNGRARGVAVAESFGTVVAEIAEVSIGENGEPRVHKVWCAVDCGIAVNPDVIRAQMQGGIGFGLGHVLYAAVTLHDGVPVQGNFDTYRSLRINEMPEIFVTIIPSTEKPTGVGEPGVPPIGPAVANALAHLGRERPRELPMVKGVLS